MTFHDLVFDVCNRRWLFQRCGCLVPYDMRVAEAIDWHKRACGYQYREGADSVRDGRHLMNEPANVSPL